VAETLNARALCTDADAKACAAVGATGTAGTTDEWIRKVNAASDAFLNLCGREIKPESTAPAARVFAGLEVIRIGCEPLELEIGDAASVTAVTVTHYDGSVTNLGGLYSTLPLRRRFAWEPIEGLKLAKSVAITDTDTITVTGVWGFPAVPEDVRQAVARAAAAWFAGDVRRYGEVFSTAEATAPADPGNVHVLPRYAWETAMRYRRMRFG
jgi:hypothetical protein